jgi:hypothetical protein
MCITQFLVLAAIIRIAVDLHDVLEIDTKNMVVRVEPCVTIGNLPLFYTRFRTSTVPVQYV